MMRKIIAVSFVILIGCLEGKGQSMHFTQYFNAPMLLNPANTALMPDHDYRLGANYRNQWAALPVPYNTFSAFADAKIGGRDDEKANWLGIGGAFFNDKAGDGDLARSQIQGSLAYHLHLSRKTMISLGLSGALVQRSVNFDNLTFDAQWDGFSFNGHMPNGEKVGLLKTSYTTIGAGMNLAFSPNDNVYVKFGGGVANINQPNESFLSKTNVIAYRPTINLDVLFRSGPDFISNPSAYYTTQSGAMEIVAGSSFRYNVGKGRDSRASELILGAYYRLNDAIIGLAGYQFGNVQFTASYDFTMSTLAPYNAGYGAMEVSVIYSSSYHKNSGIRKMISCPRFN